VPYPRNADLPKPVRDHLPKPAQTIYRKAYNNAWDEYSDRAKRRGVASRETTAHRVAWTAVKQVYKKEAGSWVKKPSS
jgi:cation transport regulator